MHDSFGDILLPIEAKNFSINCDAE